MRDKKLFLLLSTLVIIFALLALPTISNNFIVREPEDDSLKGRYVGYSWNGETAGVELSDASQYIETILELDENGVITDARIRFVVQRDGYWIPRQSGNSYVEVDFEVNPTPAIPGNDYSPGNSMFTLYNADLMAFYAVAISEDGIVAAALVCPVTRYQFEIKLPEDFDHATPFNQLTIGNGLLVPTVRTSASGLLRPQEWDSLADNSFFDISSYSYVTTIRGTFAGLDGTATTRTVLEAMGVNYSNGRPQPMEASYGYYGIGGWAGNYRAIEEFLIGKNATELTSLVDWSIERYAAGINEQNQFGIDVVTGATRTVQNGVDTISGATVRMSRESTSYQRALVEADILNAEEVIIGRF